MMTGGGYLFLDAIQIVNHFSFGYRMFNVGGTPLTSGLVLIQTIFGIGIIFYNGRNPIGWLLFMGGLAMLAFGVISSIDFRMRQMSAFELLIILVLFAGGLGLFLRSLINSSLNQV
jgi:hypothetical protein